MPRYLSLFFALSLLLPVRFSSAAITLDFQAGAISQRTSQTDSTPTTIALGTLGVLIADTVGDSFAGTDTAFANTTISTEPRTDPVSGTTLGGYLVLRTFSAFDIGGVIGFAENFTLPSYSGSFQEGTKLALVWFPSIQTTTTYPLTIGVNVAYGIYRTDTKDTASGSTIAFLAPADMTTPTLAVYDTNNGGQATPSQLTALRYTAVPEPSSVALVAAGGVLVVGRMLRRRKNG